MALRAALFSKRGGDIAAAEFHFSSLGRLQVRDCEGCLMHKPPFTCSPSTSIAPVIHAWQAARGTEISLTGHNLANRQVMEAVAEGAEPSIPVRRILLLQWTQRF